MGGGAAKQGITYEDEAFVWLGGALEAAEELGHEIHRRHIFQVHRATARHSAHRLRDTKD